MRVLVRSPSAKIGLYPPLRPHISSPATAMTKVSDTMRVVSNHTALRLAQSLPMQPLFPLFSSLADILHPLLLGRARSRRRLVSLYARIWPLHVVASLARSDQLSPWDLHRITYDPLFFRSSALATLAALTRGARVASGSAV